MRIIIKDTEQLINAFFIVLIILGLAIGGVLMIVNNADYAIQSSESASVKVPAEDYEHEQDEWKLVDLEENYNNPTYLKMKSLERTGDIVFYWQKQIFNKPDPILPDKPNPIPEASKRIRMPVYEAQEYYQVDCQNKMTRGPLLGLYWKKEGGQAINPLTHQGYWKFPAQWINSEIIKPNLQNDVCRYTEFQSSNTASHEAGGESSPL
jgi:hypothetical protein